MQNEIAVVRCPPHHNVTSLIQNGRSILAADKNIQTIEIHANWNGREGSHPTACSCGVHYHRPGVLMGFDTCIYGKELEDSPALVDLFRMERRIRQAGWFHDIVKDRSLLVVIIDRKGVAMREQWPGFNYFLLHLASDPLPSPTTEDELYARFPTGDEGRAV